MLLHYPKWRINLLTWTLVAVLSLSSICLVLFVVLPNIPNSSGRLSVIGQYPSETSFVLFVFGALANVVCVIAICCIVAWWIRSKNKNNRDISDHVAVKSGLNYNTEESITEKPVTQFSKQSQSVPEKVNRNYVSEPYQNYGYEEDEKEVFESQKDGVLPLRTSLAVSPRSSFAEDLYKSFKNIQLKTQPCQELSFKRPTSGRSFLESVDEEGYHFDNIEFSEESEDEVEVEINSESKPPFKRLDTFDLKILDAVENLQNRIELNSQADLEEEGKEEVFKSKLERSVTQESFKCLEHLRAFNAKYLSLVHVESVPSFLENEPKDLLYTDSVKGENSFVLTSVPVNCGDKEQQLTKENPSERTSPESSVSSTVGGDKNSSSELEWDSTTTDLISSDAREATRF